VNHATGFLNKQIVPALTALSENTYLSAIRAGMVSVVPLTIVGGLFIIIAYLPVTGWDARIAPYLKLLQVPVTATFGLLAVFVCFAIGYDLGKRLQQEAVVSASLATLIFTASGVILFKLPGAYILIPPVIVVVVSIFLSRRMSRVVIDG
jgi:PTS system cellobiose-specific IIC component